MLRYFVLSSLVLLQHECSEEESSTKTLHFGSQSLRYDNACENVCQDLPKSDSEPVCMMFSRYKRGYQFFVNLCHARRAICKENLVLYVVHPSRCFKSNQYYRAVN